MKLTIGNDVYTYENTLVQLKEMFEFINNQSEKRDVHISHLVIDGKEVYEDHGDYIVDRLESVEMVEVITQTTKELINSIFLSTEAYLEGALPEIETLVDEFYNEPTEETWSKYSQLLEGLQWLVQMVQTMDQFEEKLENWNEYLTVIASLQNEMNTLLEATENQDAVLISDIIQYEISPLLTTIKDNVTATIDKQGTRPELS